MGTLFLACLLLCSSSQPSRGLSEEEIQNLRVDYNQRMKEHEANELAASFCEGGVIKVRRTITRGGSYSEVLLVGRTFDERQGRPVVCVNNKEKN
jgi:hypothetical protein